MKKLIVIMSLVVTLSIAGVLYGTQDHSDKVESVTAEQLYTTQFPDPKSDFILDLVPDLILYRIWRLHCCSWGFVKYCRGSRTF